LAQATPLTEEKWIIMWNIHNAYDLLKPIAFWDPR
jgi:hypothetical protein